MLDSPLDPLRERQGEPNGDERALIVRQALLRGGASDAGRRHDNDLRRWQHAADQPLDGVAEAQVAHP